jgi:hypothetical protein
MAEEIPFENELYDQFPRGAEQGFGPDEGFNRWVRVNDRKLFTADALKDPVVAAFVDAEISVSFAQFESSHRETEYFIHKPRLAMTGQVDGILEGVDRFPTDDPRITTLVMNHERSLSFHPTHAIAVADGRSVAQVIHKEPY